jgi:hypothetical protein
MKIKTTAVGAALLALSCLPLSQTFAQTTTTTVTTSNGAFTEYVPNSETMVIKSETATAPLRYVVTKQTPIVDETGATIALERISPGSPVSIQYTGSGDRLVASKVVVHRAATTTAPVTTVPAGTEHTTTTTTTTRPLTHDEKHAIKEERERRKDAAEEAIERQKDALEDAKDKLEDDD